MVTPFVRWLGPTIIGYIPVALLSVHLRVEPRNETSIPALAWHNQSPSALHALTPQGNVFLQTKRQGAFKLVQCERCSGWCYCCSVGVHRVIARLKKVVLGFVCAVYPLYSNSTVLTALWLHTDSSPSITNSILFNRHKYHHCTVHLLSPSIIGYFSCHASIYVVMDNGIAFCM